ncbi:MotA/TolQ/ExbB proton channel family protein [Oscillibacter sp.]|uniref:motility protein A n=1 Tax=Oscillibacter sp. TaxID=1945593 RepID=UPI0028992B22|nr:MotA/TolQ/ExbB proton channel family protein [Oscillibacter sp.]
MNITYIIGTVVAMGIMIAGMMFSSDASGFVFEPGQVMNFLDPASVLITIGCTFAVVVASFPPKMLKNLPRHFRIMLNTKKYDPMYYIDQLVELAQVARKNGLLALEEKANAQDDPFFKQAIMLIVDANDADKVRGILNNDIECMSARHDGVAGMYERGSSVAPAFGMVGTLVGLINMLKNMNLSGDGGSSSIGSDMGTALITTLYGCVLAHMIFNPIASNLRTRDEEEVLCKMIIVEGIMSIQSGENPKSLREKLLTFVDQNKREEGGAKGEKKSRGKKKNEE